MADIINLRRWKKDKARSAKEDTAAKNRAASSISAKSKKHARLRAQRDDRMVEAHRLESAPEADDNGSTAENAPGKDE